MSSFYNEYGNLDRRAEYICDTVVERLEENLVASDDYDVAWESNHEYEITDKPHCLMSIESIGVAVNLNRIYMRIPDLLLRQMPFDPLCDLMTHLAVKSVLEFSGELPYTMEFTEDFLGDFMKPSMEVRTFLYEDLYRMYDNRLRVCSKAGFAYFKHHMVNDPEYRIGVLTGVEMLRIIDQLGDSNDWIIVDGAPYDSAIWHTLGKYGIYMNPSYLNTVNRIYSSLNDMAYDIHRSERLLNDVLRRDSPSNAEKKDYAKMMIEGVFRIKE